MSMTVVVSEATVADDLEGLPVETGNFGLFTILTASQAPELNAVGISARHDAAEGGCVFLGFLPYGTQVRVR